MAVLHHYHLLLLAVAMLALASIVSSSSLVGIAVVDQSTMLRRGMPDVSNDFTAKVAKNFTTTGGQQLSNEVWQYDYSGLRSLSTYVNATQVGPLSVSSNYLMISDSYGVCNTSIGYEENTCSMSCLDGNWCDAYNYTHAPIAPEIGGAKSDSYTQECTACDAYPFFDMSDYVKNGTCNGGSATQYTDGNSVTPTIHDELCIDISGNNAVPIWYRETVASMITTYTFLSFTPGRPSPSTFDVPPLCTCNNP
eukprot:TRINITY_DN5634_c0_g1_i1.p1 TRINITY_DN5634_c0_g1~~TRINITY_DN5634_c0_g1_i1.p1  ORF type:complete len:251 (+),score=31.51 TRINITY_DN5634_c0_g1_i1:261-1013(+)